VTLGVDINRDFTLKRGVGLSPEIDNTIQLSEFPIVELLISGAADRHWQSSSSELLLAGASESFWKIQMSLDQGLIDI
jgi:hypothetical protein